MNAYDHETQAPYRLHLETDKDGRIMHKTEYVTGRPPREFWYTYSGGKLQIVRPQPGAASLALEMYQYNNQDQRVESWHSGAGAAKGQMRYAYSGDRLLGVDMSQYAGTKTASGMSACAAAKCLSATITPRTTGCFAWKNRA